MCPINRPTCDAAAPAEASEEAPFKLEDLTARCLGSIALVERLLASFEQRFPVEAAEIAESLEAGDVPRLIRSAHQLKGAAANMSAPLLRSILEQVEHAARAGQLSGIPGYLDQLQQQWQRFCQFRSAANNSPSAPCPTAANIHAAIATSSENDPCVS